MPSMQGSGRNSGGATAEKSGCVHRLHTMDSFLTAVSINVFLLIFFPGIYRRPEELWVQWQQPQQAPL